MKKLAIFMVVFYNIIQASSVGNPTSCGIIKEGFYFSPASWYNLRIGYEGEYTQNRKLETDKNETIDNFEQWLHSASLTVNLLNRLDLFGTFGEASIKTNWLISEEVNSYSLIAVESKFDKAWSLGAKAIFFEWGDIFLSAGGRYYRTKPKIRLVSKEAEVTPVSHYHINFWQWNVDLGLAYKIDMLIPYIAAKYSKAKASPLFKI